MQYLLLIYEAEELWESKSEAEKGEVLKHFFALNDRLAADGVEFSANPLMPVATAVSVRVRGGDRNVSDGPFAETKEQLAGYYLIDVASLDQAVEYAAMIPLAQTGTIEVRPIEDHSDIPVA